MNKNIMNLTSMMYASAARSRAAMLQNSLSTFSGKAKASAKFPQITGENYNYADSEEGDYVQDKKSGNPKSGEKKKNRSSGGNGKQSQSSGGGSRQSSSSRGKREYQGKSSEGTQPAQPMPSDKQRRPAVAGKKKTGAQTAGKIGLETREELQRAMAASIILGPPVSRRRNRHESITGRR